MTAHFEIEDLACAYDGRTVLEVPALALRSGEVTAIVGPNGAGKSTLIRCLAGVMPPARGTIRLQGVDLSRFTDRERARRIAYLPADSRLAWPMIARRVVELGRFPFLKPLTRLDEADRAAVETSLALTDTGHLADRAFSELSSGEKARILVARSLATQAEALLLDEPGAALDPRHQLAVMEILTAEAQNGRCVAFAGHSLDQVSRFADRVIVVHEGRIAADGAPRLALDADTLRNVFGLNAPDGIAVQTWQTG
ncbi:ABC transporter ATP-binding protein [Hyphobacterium sp.]|jgi:iron complex transport system ATP-binding protein|uniref:ABC transporter ATP-binding protein n=1 Tax=Hyphobacterium sp. TaxID=2004662 RepID=UPI003BACF5DB